MSGDIVLVLFVIAGAISTAGDYLLGVDTNGSPSDISPKLPRQLDRGNDGFGCVVPGKMRRRSGS